jgi:polysaccharide biosynthesis transport protein
MNPESHSRSELARPITDPAAVVARTPLDGGAFVPVSRTSLAKPASTATLSSTSILRALQRRQLLALGTAILASGICGPAAWFLVPPAKFKAQARLQVAAQPPKLLFRTVETEGTNEDYKRYQNTQVTLVTSQLALNAALDDKDVGRYRTLREQVDPVAWLQANLKVEFIAASEVMEISLSGDDPREVAGIVNAVRTAYMEVVVNVATKQRADRYDQLKSLKTTYGDLLKEKREMLRKLAEAVGSTDRQTIALKQQISEEHLAYIRRELLDVQSQKRKAEARLKTRAQTESPGETSAPVFSEADINRWIDQDPVIADLTAKLTRDEDRFNSERLSIRGIARNAGADPAMQKMTQDIAARRKSLKSKRAALRPVAIRQLEDQEHGDQVTKSDGIEQERAMLEDLEKQLTNELNATNVGNQALTKTTLDLQTHQDEVAQMEDAATQIGKEVEALTVELRAPARIRKIEDAVVPRTRDEKKRLTIIATIILGSFFAGMFGIAFLELQRQKVDSADDVPTDLGLQVVGTLPILLSRDVRGRGITGRRNESNRYWQNLMLESIDATRTMLVHAARTGSHRVVMITSAVAGEGKTSLASHLATSLARSGLRTLLIDADLRSPSIHRLFSLPAAAGLSEVLRGEVEWANAIADTTLEELKVLTAGQCDRRTISLLAQGGLGPFFAELKDRFDFVIVDSSPILPVADGLMIAQHVDAVLFSIFRDVSRKTKVSAAAERFQALGVRILGAVVTGAHGGRYGTAYDAESPYPLLPDSAASPSVASN